MMGWVKRMIAWAVVGDELEELERWRVECADLSRWLAEFPDVGGALVHLRGVARGDKRAGHLCDLRERMRKSREGRAAIMAPITLTLRQDLTRDEVESFKHLWRGETRLHTGPIEEVEAATDWDVAEQHVRALDQARQHACDAVDRTLSDPPTHLMGLLPPSPRRVAYKFLSPGCDARS